jgi:hypothetical protein
MNTIWLESFPRLRVFYMYFFEYEENYIPLLKASNQSHILPFEDIFQIKNTKDTYNSKEIEITKLDLTNVNIKFLLKFTLLPYIQLKNIVDNLFYQTNKWTAFVIKINCFLLTSFEYLFIFQIVKKIYKKFDKFFIKYHNFTSYKRHIT